MPASGHDTHGDVMERGVQDRLIEAAAELFCRRGFNETSVRDIAASADGNVASVNYYFGGKDNLSLAGRAERPHVRFLHRGPVAEAHCMCQREGRQGPVSSRGSV